MEEFLKTVARHYCTKSRNEAQLRHEPESLPLSRYLFCFPNRRSGLFFSRFLEKSFGSACCVPAMTTISELFGHFSTKNVLDRTALLFRLYHIYQQLNSRPENETFDQFVFWGDMLLSDFDDVDKYMVDADHLFSNVRDLKEIDARFAGFTEEQIAVIQSFWHNFRAEKEYPKDDKHEVFGQTWAILAPLYHAFRESLKTENAAYEGMMEREVVESLLNLTEDATSPLAQLQYDKVVFVGLTAVSEVDRKLMFLLKKEGRAEFCWDYADPRLKPEISVATSAAYFTRNNLSDFGNELSDEELQRGLVREEDREVSLYAISSGVGQTQQARKILEQWKMEDGEQFDPFRTAVVLPDEKLLLPMLYAVPSDLGAFNVTMGYGLKSTPITAFVDKLAALQQAWRPNEKSFYFRQVLPILSHSLILSVAGEEARKLSQEIVSQNLNQVPIDVFKGDFLKMVFRPINTALDTIAYLKEILDLLMQKASDDIQIGKDENLADEYGQMDIDFEEAESDEVMSSSVETGSPKNRFTDTDYEFFYHYRKTLLQLEKEVNRQTFSFTSKTLFLLLSKLVSGVSVPFSGEPLKGLQIMGVLETRGLDFDNVIILSMNEGVFPAKPVQNTFVPMSLRDAFGLPTQRHRDSVFAYHFYRLIGRAHRLAMIYDSRSEGMQTGEESRYIKQLRFLMGHEDLKAQTVTDNIGIVGNSSIEVHKTPEVMEQLRQCLDGVGCKNFSASVLKSYIQCPLKFYFSFVRQLQEDDEVSEGVDSALFGDILHHALQDLYSSCEGKRVEASMLKNYIDHPDREIERAIRRAFKDVMHVQDPQGYNLLVLKILSSYIVETLRHDMRVCPFDYKAGERKHQLVFNASDDLSVRIKCIYDRLDVPVADQRVVRIVDYKTGNSNTGKKLVFPSVEDLFNPDGKGSSEAFQVMLYCLMLEQLNPEQLAEFHLDSVPEKVAPHLYFVRDFHPRTEVRTVLAEGSGLSAVPMSDFSAFRDEFRARLSDLFREIFDPDKPFGQCENTKACSYCPFLSLCKRI